MPCTTGNCKIDYRKWLRCRAVVVKAMIGEGWNKHAKKFDDVLNRRAKKLYSAA